MKERLFCSAAVPPLLPLLRSSEMMWRGLMKTEESVERSNGDRFHMKIEQAKSIPNNSSKRSAPSNMPLKERGRVETQAAPAWCLPGGVRLADYALRGGFVASSLLLRGERHR